MTTDYFALFGLPASFALDSAALEAAYFKEQRANHPDRMAGRSPEERLQASGRSATVNDAYGVLKDDMKRAQHLLALHGIRVNSEADTIKPDLALLQEVMEWREEFMEAHGDTAAISRLRDTLNIIKEDSLTGLQGYFTTQQYEQAAHETIRLNYISKLLQDIK